jgi:methyl-accepting chemotaxis protein
MRWKDLKISLKLTIGFGSLLIFLIIVSSLSLFGFAEIKKANQELTQKKDSELFLMKKEIDHLTWIKNLSTSLLTQMPFKGGVDSHKCAFGKWYYAQKSSDTIR